VLKTAKSMVERQRILQRKESVRQRFPIGGFVLVGGDSRRMGRDKALLEWHDEPLLLRAAKLLTTHLDSVTLLGPPARYSRFGLPVLADDFTQAGPLAGLATALRHSCHEWNLLLACDLPLVDGRVIKRLIEQIATTRARAVVPKTAGGWQPLCAAYHRGCLTVMEEALAQRELSVIRLLQALPVEELTASPFEDPFTWEQLFRNINTAEEWEQVRRSLEKQ
jgi:molybdopterin-guanine dinucleotide biosynthesis protein A